MEDGLRTDLMVLKSQLQALDVERVELASISGHKGSERQGTNAGFALDRFLDYAGSLCDSPPRSLSVSPVIAPSDDVVAAVGAESGTLTSSFSNASSERGINVKAKRDFAQRYCHAAALPDPRL